MKPRNSLKARFWTNLFPDEHDGPSGEACQKPGNPGPDGQEGHVAAEEEQDEDPLASDSATLLEV